MVKYVGMTVREHDAVYASTYCDDGMRNKEEYEGNQNATRNSIIKKCREGLPCYYCSLVRGWIKGSGVTAI